MYKFAIFLQILFFIRLIDANSANPDDAIPQAQKDFKKL